MKRILIVCLLLFSMGMANAQMIPLPGGAPAEINPNDYKSRHDFYQKAAYDYFNYMMGTKKAGTPGYESYVANQLLDEMYVYLRYEDPNDEAHGFVAKTVLMTDYYRLKKLNRESIDWQWSFLQEDIKSYEEAQNKYFKLLPKMSESDKFSVYVPLHQLGVQILKKGNTKEQSDYKLIDVFIFNALFSGEILY